jgi:hypothetical protein
MEISEVGAWTSNWERGLEIHNEPRTKEIIKKNPDLMRILKIEDPIVWGM